MRDGMVVLTFLLGKAILFRHQPNPMPRTLADCVQVVRCNR